MIKFIYKLFWPVFIINLIFLIIGYDSILVKICVIFSVIKLFCDDVLEMIEKNDKEAEV